MFRFPRPLILALAALAVAIICLPALAAQPPGRQPGAPRGPGRMFGMMGRGGGLNLLGVVTNEGAQAKLGLTEEEKSGVTKLAEEARASGRGGMAGFREMTQEEREAAMKKFMAQREARQKEIAKKLKALLKEEKYNKLVLIAAGVALRGGPMALGNPAVGEAVGLPKESQAKVTKIVQGSGERMRAIFEEMRGGGDRAAMQEKRRALQKEINGKISAALTKEEKDKVRKARDAAEGIELRRGGFGGGRPGGGRRPGGGPPQ